MYLCFRTSQCCVELMLIRKLVRGIHDFCCLWQTLESCALRHALNAVLACSFQDGIGVHLLCGLTAGLAATTLGSPWDVIGTRSGCPLSDAAEAATASGLLLQKELGEAPMS